MKKGDVVYLYEEGNYHEAAQESGAVSDQTVFATLEGAAEYAINQIAKYEENEFVVDKEDLKPTKERIIASVLRKGSYSVIMFDSYQENWDFHFEVSVEKMVVR